ncbi:MAG: RNA polymerase sigma factor [Acidobacteriota bacterium]|nr:RNA polymerase sigma factor [Acidobacteriota bacterium]
MPALAPAAPPTDSELIEEILGGRLDAYDELMGRYERHVYKTSWGFGGSHENAMDLSQAVFLKAYRRLGSFEGRSGFKTWLMKIAYNEGVSWLRSNRRHVQGRESFEGDFGKLAAAPSTPDQEMQQLQKEQQRILLGGLGRLSRRYRTALVLRYLHGLSVREVASVLECSEGTAKNVLFRGVRNLRKEVVRA